jgi:hypothetical protein
VQNANRSRSRVLTPSLLAQTSGSYTSLVQTIWS